MLKSVGVVDKKTLLRKIEQFMDSRKEIVFAYVFGSFSEREVFNDIDIAVYTEDTKGVTTSLWYEIELSTELEKILKIPVDVIRLNDANAFVIHRASKGILIKNNDDDTRTEFVTKSWKNYMEFKCKLNEHVRVMKGE